MLFNTDKCKVLHFGKNNRKYTYKLGEQILESTRSEKDLNINIQDNIMKETHIDSVLRKQIRF